MIQFFNLQLNKIKIKHYILRYKLKSQLFCVHFLLLIIVYKIAYVRSIAFSL